MFLLVLLGLEIRNFNPFVIDVVVILLLPFGLNCKDPRLEPVLV
jgi:hypothetical protein